MDPRRWSFTRQTLAVLVLLLTAVLVVAFGGSAVVLQRQADDDAGRIAIAVARSVAEDDDVRAGAAAASDAPAPATDADRAALADGPVQVAAEAARLRTGSFFVVVTDDRGLRLSHPEPDRLGLPVSSDPSVPLAGGELVEEGTGTLGEAARAKVPVFAPGSDRVVGEVSVGVPAVEVDRLARDATLLAAATAVLALLGGVAGAVLLARRLRRLTHGVEPEELGALLQGHEAVLFGIGDGVVAVGPDGRVVLANEEAVRLLGRPVDAGDTTEDWPAALRSLVADPDPVASLTVLGDRALLCSSRRVERDGRQLGVVLTLRDRTDVELLARQLDAVAEAGTVLRAQRHEFANRLHLVAGLLDAGSTEEAGEYVHTLLGTGPLGTAVEGLDAVRDPYLQAFVAAKAAHAREGGVELRLGGVSVRGRLVDPVDVTTVLGNLVDNAVAALAGRSGGVVELDLVQDGDTLVVAVADNGPGVPDGLGDRVFEAGVTTRPSGEGGIGLGLVRQVARSRGGAARLASAGGAGELGGAVFVVELPGVLDRGEGLMADFTVLVVDDDFRVAELHAQAVASVPGFVVAGRAGTRAAARTAVAARRQSGTAPFDLALVDVYLPDGSGIGLLPELDCDAFVLSAATELPTFRAALRAGALGYLVKPFPERVLQSRLRAYARYRRVLADALEVDQELADAARTRCAGTAGAARSASSATRDLLLQALRTAGEPQSAADLAAATGVSRATAQRHLSALDADGRLELVLRYGTTGRPEQRYSPRG